VVRFKKELLHLTYYWFQRSWPRDTEGGEGGRESAWADSMVGGRRGARERELGVTLGTRIFTILSVYFT